MLFHVLLAAATSALAGLHDPASIAVLSEGHQFTEGPVWANGTLLFTDIPANRIYTGTREVFREPSGQANGLTLDREGRLLAAEHKTRRVTRTEKDGTITVIADTFEGKPFNSPNDIVVRRDGVIFFTDPPYGLEGGMANSALGYSGVYAVEPETGVVTLVSRDFNKPNGLCFSPDEQVLYVADTEGSAAASEKPGSIRAFRTGKSGASEGDRLFCQLPFPDGIKSDVLGNIWATGEDGVRVYDPSGQLLETVVLPEGPANCAFGGADGSTLFVTARTRVYTVKTSVTGIIPGAK